MTLLRLPSPGPTTLERMHAAASIEAERIEMAQLTRVAAGLQSEPATDQVSLRNDFIGLERLVSWLIDHPDMARTVMRGVREAQLPAAPAAPEAPPAEATEDSTAEGED